MKNGNRLIVELSVCVLPPTLQFCFSGSTIPLQIYKSHFLHNSWISIFKPVWARKQPRRKSCFRDVSGSTKQRDANLPESVHL